MIVRQVEPNSKEGGPMAALLLIPYNPFCPVKIKNLFKFLSKRILHYARVVFRKAVDINLNNLSLCGLLT